MTEHDDTRDGEDLSEYGRLKARVLKLEDDLREERLRLRLLRDYSDISNPEFFGCFTGDCPHSTQDECDTAIHANMIKEFNNGVAREEELLESQALHKAEIAGLTATYKAAMENVEAVCEGHCAEMEQLTAQRDALLEACMAAHGELDGGLTVAGNRTARLILKSALAKVEGAKEGR